jgi:hypothetical protein
MMRFRVLLAAALLLALAPAASAPAATSKVKRCTPKGARTIHRTSEARVYTLKGPSERSGDETVQRRLYGCLFSTGRPVLLTESYDDDFVASGEFSQVRVNGRFVAWQFDASDVSCKADCPPDYNPLTQTIHIADLKSRKKKSTTGAAKPDTLSVTRGGTAIWLDSVNGDPHRLRMR